MPHPSPVTSPTPPAWPHCAHNPTPDDSVGCRGIHVPGHTACLAHLADPDRDTYLSGLVPGSDIDHRGTTFTEPLLNDLLATVRDSESGHPTFGNARFESATFTGDTNFESAIFAGYAGFREATFTGDTWFQEATFTGDTSFDWTTFTGEAWFDKATFTGVARFGEATFAGYAGFSETTFTGRAWFGKATFTGNAWFGEATFADTAEFVEATFAGYAWFAETRFTGNAEFREATFTGTAGFDSATFMAHAGFAEATFSEITGFESATFTAHAGFESATFTAHVGFDSATFTAHAGFESATFTAHVGFDSAIFTGDAGFNSATFTEGAGFDSATFTGDASFSSATFTGNVSFKDATFMGTAGFKKTTFADFAWFETATFTGNAEFEEAAFADLAWFGKATFTGYAGFESAIFTGDAEFGEATFTGDAWFGKATFERDTEFGMVTFAGNARFHSTAFKQTASFGPLECAGRLQLSGAVFGGPVTLLISARRLECRRTRWSATAELRLRYATVDFAQAVFEYPLTITAEASPLALNNGQPMAEQALAGSPDATVRMASMRGVDAAHLVLADVDLSQCLFTGTVHLDQLRLEGTCTFDKVPAHTSWRHWHPVRFTQRHTLAEEHHWRARQPAAVPGWNRAVFNASRAGPAQLAPVYRALRKSYEDSKNEPGAADFYYGEMEMRRHDQTSSTRTERGLLHGYWLLSGYGLRASRALGWLAAAMLTTIVLLMGFGLPQDEPKQEATGKVPPGGGMVTFEIDKDHPQNPTKDRFTGERFEKALNVTLNSVVFRSSGQDLTTAGTYIEMASRVTEPILLGLAVLAVRNRVKR